MQIFMSMTSRFLLLRATAVLLFVTAFAPLSVAQTAMPERWENGITEPWWFDEKSISKEDVAVARSLWEAIEDENRAVPNEWAGDYFIGGDTHGSYLRWSRSNGFVLTHIDKCQAMLMGLTYGKVIATPALVQLLPAHDMQSTHTHAHMQTKTLKFIPVIWGGSRLLIPAGEMSDFGDYIVGLGKYNQWVKDGFLYMESVEFFSKREGKGYTDRSAPETEEGGRLTQDLQPIVPPGYERYVKKPIDAKITVVGPRYRKINRENDWWDDLIIPVTINAGSVQGVKSGMIFRVLGAKGFGGFGESVEIKHAGLRSSRGVIARPIRKSPCVKFDETDTCTNPDYDSVIAGWQVTTSPFK